MASPYSGTNMMCFLKNIWGDDGIKKSLLCCQITLKSFLLLSDRGSGKKRFSDVLTCIFPLRIQYFIWSRPPPMTQARRHGGCPPIKREQRAAAWPSSVQSARKCRRGDAGHGTRQRSGRERAERAFMRRGGRWDSGPGPGRLYKPEPGFF